MKTGIQELDETDIRILRILQENCRLTTKELALKIHLSTTPTFERQKRLERMGFISKYIAVLDAGRLDRGFMVFCNVSMKQINREIASAFAEVVAQWGEVTECYNISGDGDYLLKICVSSMRHYQEFLLNKLGTFPHVAHLRSIFVMDTLKLNYGITI
ncbi:MAG: Lrp/AsnC family transcriptional regulator [Bacteroides sp.]|nr:Lrp/AsnC family transcriptional regulator [Roseburia sp.]MCM1347080.1 Lrp/AsnC family transcriptional regulator [Bacteroides sp.]MCM1420537.1 Lrp/AsnC family transcriptional regulator [Bacteroides sp.]